MWQVVAVEQEGGDEREPPGRGERQERSLPKRLRHRPGGSPAQWVLGRTGWPAAASAMAWSLSAGTAPLTPTAPMILPSSTTAIATRKPSSRALAAPLSMHSRACLRVSAMSWHLHDDVVGFHPHFVEWHARATPGEGALSRPHVVNPAVPRAGEAGSAELALAQRTPFVGACIAAGVDPIADPGENDPGAVEFDEPGLARRHLLEGGGAYFHRLHVLLEDVGAVQTAHVLPAHLGRLAHGIHRLGLLLRRRAVTLDNLVAALTVHLVGLDVDGEELHLVIRKAVMGLERRQISLVDARYLGLEPHQEPRSGDMEGLARHLVAPRGEPAGGRQLARGFDLLPAHSAGLRKPDEQVHMLGSRLLLDDVLEQEVSGVGVRAVAVDRGAPA